MTANDLLQLLLATADGRDHVFDYSEIARWPATVVGDFEQLGLLRASSNGLTAPCPSCAESHIEPVVTRVGPDGRQRFFIWCPESMRVEVTAEMCRGWEVSPEGLASTVANALDLNGRPKTVVPGRLWRLGRIPWAGKTREVVLALRMRENDAGSIATHGGAGGRTIVLVPHFVPDDRIWPGHVPAVVALSRIATADGAALCIDGVAMVESVTEADALAESRSKLPVDPEVKKQIIRQQVKAEIKAHLEDDVLVAAYFQYGSGDKAAAALTEQLGRPISRDRVYRAVNRAREAGELDVPGDSPSIGRTVASQSRDRAKKIAQRR